MKTLLNYQKFTEQTNKGFVKVPTQQAKTNWRNLLLDYRYLHSINVTITKSNRKYVFNTLEKLRKAQNDLIEAIDNDENQEVKTDLINVITNFQKLLTDLSEIKDEPKEEKKEETTPFVPTMIYFDRKLFKEDGETVYITKGGRRFTVKDKKAENYHLSLIAKCNEITSLRVEEKAKAKKQSLKEAKETETSSAPKTTKVKNDKVIDPKQDAKRLEKREAMKIGVENTKGDKFVERVYEKKRLF